MSARVTDAGKSVVFAVVDDDSTSGPEFAREGGLEAVGVRSDFQALGFEESDYVIMSVKLFIAELWVFVDL